ncbi:MAG: transposase [Turicibacter sp.]|nr:transposase [Turicibacter sp.]
MLQFNLLAESNRLDRLKEHRDPLTKAQNIVNWELFRPILEDAFNIEARGPGRRLRFDSIPMFKIVKLQQWYGISDYNTEFAINNRLSFQRFLGLQLNVKVPDAKTFWLFKEKLKETGTGILLFQLYANQMKSQGIITKKGLLVDATFVDAPHQRNSRKKTVRLRMGVSLKAETRRILNKAKSLAKKYAGPMDKESRMIMDNV